MVGQRTCCNLPPAGKDELARKAPIKAPAPALAPASTDELFKQFMKVHQKAQTQPLAQNQPELRERPFNARFSDLYYKELHLDYYYFCQ